MNLTYAVVIEQTPHNYGAYAESPAERDEVTATLSTRFEAVEVEISAPQATLAG